MKMVNYTGIDYEKIAHQIDPSLVFISQLGVTARAVCKVEQAGIPYVLKAFNVNYWEAPKKMAFERRVLGATSSVEGITHLVRDYGQVGEYEAILKQYFEGTNLSGHPLLSPEISFQLEKILGQLHFVGLSDVRFGEDDVIISPEGIVKLIELDSCSFNDKQTAADFEKSLKKDLAWIREIKTPSQLRVPGQYGL